MFIANTITAWYEAFTAVFDNDYPWHADLQDVQILTEYPLQEVNYPGIWIDFAPVGVAKNVGIGHVEYAETGTGGFTEVYRWQFGGQVEVTIGAMSNLERALLLDEVARVIAVSRADENNEGALRKSIHENDLIGMNVVWESFTISGLGETQGTPWGADDVIYEATISLEVSGEVILNPSTSELVPFSGVVFDVTTDPATLPIPGTEGWM